MELVPQTQFDLFLGYSAFFLFIFGYVVLLRLEQRRISREMEELRSSAFAANAGYGGQASGG